MPTIPPTVTSVETPGEFVFQQLIVVADTHTAVAQTALSMRELGVKSDAPKLRPLTVTVEMSVRAALSWPR